MRDFGIRRGLVVLYLTPSPHYPQGGVNTMRSAKAVRTALFRKATHLEELQMKVAESQKEWFPVEHVIILTDAEFEEFTSNFLEDYKWLEGYDEILLICNSQYENFIVVDKQGYDYARYVGLAYEITWEE